MFTTTSHLVQALSPGPEALIQHAVHRLTTNNILATLDNVQMAADLCKERVENPSSQLCVRFPTISDWIALDTTNAEMR